jgi:hypothetical protein
MRFSKVALVLDAAIQYILINVSEEHHHPVDGGNNVH